MSLISVLFCFLFYWSIVDFVEVQSLSRVWFFVTPWTTTCQQASLSFTVSQSLLKLMSIELVMPSNRLILCHPFSSCLQSFPASVSFPMSRLLHQVAKVLTLQLHQSFQWIFRVSFLWDCLITLTSKGLSRVFSKVKFLFVICIVRNYDV